MSLLYNTPACHSFQPSMMGMAVWSICRSIDSLLPSTCVFCRNHPVAPELPGGALDLDSVQIFKRHPRRFGVAHRQQRHGALVKIARPHRAVAGGELSADMVSPHGTDSDAIRAPA